MLGAVRKPHRHLWNMRPIPSFANNIVRLETTPTVVIRVKDKALRTSYFLYRAHVIIIYLSFVAQTFSLCCPEPHFIKTGNAT